MTGGPWTRSIKVVHGPGPKRGSMDPWSMFCPHPLQPNFVRFFTQSDLNIKQTLVSHFSPADYENFKHIRSMKNDDLPLSNMANTEVNVCYKILRAGYCLLVVRQENVFSRCTMTKEYFSISHLPNFFLTVQNECILLCLNGMSKAAIPGSNTVHFFGAL